jgi:photosystem II stability/assembly factor-like uncharacterized protein
MKTRPGRIIALLLLLATAGPALAARTWEDLSPDTGDDFLCVFATDSGRVLVGGNGDLVRELHGDDLQPLDPLPVGTEAIQGFCLPDNRTLLAVDARARVLQQDQETREWTVARDSQSHAATGLHCGEYVLLCADSVVERLDTATSTWAALDNTPTTIHSGAWSTPERLFTCGQDGNVWSYTAGTWSMQLALYFLNSDDLPLYAIHGMDSGPDNEPQCFVVGAQGVIFAWAGNTWSVSRPWAPDQPDLHDVHVAAADLAWAVGDQGVVLAWDGQAWTDLGAPTSSDLRGVCPAPGTDPALYVAGRQGTFLRLGVAGEAVEETPLTASEAGGQGGGGGCLALWKPGAGAALLLALLWLPCARMMSGSCRRS